MQTWKLASMTVSPVCELNRVNQLRERQTDGTDLFLSESASKKLHMLSRFRRREDSQDVRAGASGGEEREVVHREGRGGAERPEPGEPAARGAVR